MEPSSNPTEANNKQVSQRQLNRIKLGSLLIGFVLSMFVIWMVYASKASASLPFWAAYLPIVNVSMNSLSLISLVAGWYFIKKGHRELHVKSMCWALFFSTVFLGSYLLYHYLQGSVKFQGTGMIRYVYFPLLISHIILSIVNLPLILMTFFLAIKGYFSTHKKIAKPTIILWIYNSFSGIAVFVLLKLNE